MGIAHREGTSRLWTVFASVGRRSVRRRWLRSTVGCCVLMVCMKSRAIDMAVSGRASSSASATSPIGRASVRSRRFTWRALPLLNGGRVDLLDNDRLVAQICGLERRTARGGRDSVDHGPGGHDDLANAALGAAMLAVGRRDCRWCGDHGRRGGARPCRPPLLPGRCRHLGGARRQQRSWPSASAGLLKNAQIGALGDVSGGEHLRCDQGGEGGGSGAGRRCPHGGCSGRLRRGAAGTPGRRSCEPVACLRAALFFGDYKVDVPFGRMVVSPFRLSERVNDSSYPAQRYRPFWLRRCWLCMRR